MIQLGTSTATATIAAPIESIHLGDWMFTLTSAEYAACAKGHQSAALGQLPSGKRMSINVEFVAGYQMVQHYIEQLAERDHVIGVSPNTVLWINDVVYVLLQITWELRVKRLNHGSCELTCHVKAETENQVFAEQVHANNAELPEAERPTQLHINEETPLFARDIERKARAGRWS